MLSRFVRDWLAPRLIGSRPSSEEAAFYAERGDDPVRWVRTLDVDFVVGGWDSPYLLRWYLIPRNPVFNAYLHLFLRSDDDRALHDHPWFNASVLLFGAYTEHTIAAGGVNVRTRREAGQVAFRGPRAAHRIELTDGPCWTLFLTGPRLRAWGFHCPNGWVHWKRFTDTKGGVSTTGAGCGEAA